jgi:hypothetical protein
MRQQRRTVPYTKWLSVLCTHCRQHTSISTLTYIPGQARYCSDCRKMMKDTSDDQE